MTADAADDAWHALSASLEDSEPLCNGDDLFTADRLPDEDRAWCASICARCPLLVECGAYARAAQVKAGFWAGHFHTSKGKTWAIRPPSPSTTADRTVSGNHQEKEEPS